MRRFLVNPLVFAGALLAVGSRPGLLAETVPLQPFYAVENGDLNGDWQVDVSDGIYLLRHVFLGGPDPVPIAAELGGTPLLNGDVNADRDIDVSDAIYLMSFLFLGGKPPIESRPQAMGGAGNPNPRIIPTNARPYGKTFGEWSAAWWRWVLSIPAPVNPLLGTGCGENQTGSVWFLVGTGGGEPLTRSCAVPSGKAIFFPIVNVENDYPCPDPSFQPAPGQTLEEFLTEGAQFYIDHVTELEVEVDGVPLEDLFRYRVTSPLYTFTGDPSLTVFDPCIAGEPQPAVSDGYWVMLAPLSSGSHVIHSRGKEVFPEWDWTFESDVTFDLEIVPGDRP